MDNTLHNSKNKLERIASVWLKRGMLVFGIVFLLYLICPMFGTQFVPEALVNFGSIAGFLMGIRLSLPKHIPGLKPRDFSLIAIYDVICMFLWFEWPLNALLSVMLTVGGIWHYRMIRKSRTEKHGKRP